MFQHEIKYFTPEGCVVGVLLTYPLTVQRFLKSSLSGYTDSGENLKVST
jgi:hypothetical protein